jgi:transposase
MCNFSRSKGVEITMAQSSRTVEIDRKALAELILRVEEAIEHNLALSVDDLKLLLLAISTLCTLQEKIEADDVTLHKLRKLLGMVQQSERRSVSSPIPKNKKKKSQKNNKDKKNKSPSKPPKIIHHAITEYQRGQVCPACNIGKLYKSDPGVLLRVTGHARFEAEKHITEQLRCNACQEVYKAPLPESVLEDGDADQMYAYSARTLMVIDKFFSGIPYYHQANLADIFGHSMGASTVFDQCEHVANAVMPIFYELKRQAATGYQFLLDDTRNRILEQKPELRDKPNGKGQVLRTGVYSSGLIAQLSDGHEVVLFETSLGHAGEHLNSILKLRPSGLPPPLTMSDALSSNSVTALAVKSAFCNSHARRNFFDIKSRHPAEIDWVLETYAGIWEAEDIIKEENLNPDQRLAYHQQHSLPAMQSIRDWAANKLEKEDFEEYSALGKAIHYFLKHYEKLILFCVEPGALIDNNRMEEKLKILIRGRKMAHFYKTVNGASVANVLISLVATAYGADENVYDYLVALQRHKQHIKEDPRTWLPWNYKKTLDTIDATSKNSGNHSLKN